MHHVAFNTLRNQILVIQQAVSPQRIIQLRTGLQESFTNEVKLLGEINNIWAHYWDDHLYPISYSFFSKKLTSPKDIVKLASS